MTAPNFPTTQEIDTYRSMPMVDLFITPVKAIKHSPKKALALLKLIREASPSLSIAEFKTAYGLSDNVCDWIEQQVAL